MTNGTPSLSTGLRRRLEGGKLFQFVFSTLFFGLLQLWIVLVLSESPSLAQVFGDGGVFFFTTSLLVSSMLSLHERELLKSGSGDLTVTCCVAVPTFFLAIVIYSSIVPEQLSAASPVRFPFASKVVHQIGSGAVATVYAVYAAIRTGQLTK